MDDTPEDKQAIQRVLPQIMMYPLAEYDGTDEEHRLEQDRRRLPTRRPATRRSKWVFPEKFFDELPAVLADAPPLPGEEARYAQVLAVLEAPRPIRR